MYVQVHTFVKNQKAYCQTRYDEHDYLWSVTARPWIPYNELSSQGADFHE